MRLVLAWEYSGHLVMTVEVDTDEVVIRLRCSRPTPSTLLPDARSAPGPDRLAERSDAGDLDDGAAALRS